MNEPAWYWEVLVTLAVMGVFTFAVFGAIYFFCDWLPNREKKSDIAHRERQAAEEIAAVTLQAQMAILREAMRRNRPSYVDAEVLGADDDPWKPRWTA